MLILQALWDFIIILVLLAVCVITPARVAFTDEDDLTWAIVGFLFDLLFGIDLVLNFFMAYHDEEFNLIDDRKVSKHLVTLCQTISKEYLKSWFTVDLISVIPMNLILSIGSYNSLARIARIPKLYRLVKITRCAF